MNSVTKKVKSHSVFVSGSIIEAGNNAMLADKAYEIEAKEWIEGTITDSGEENEWQFKAE